MPGGTGCFVHPVPPLSLNQLKKAFSSPNRSDLWIALGVGILALVAYVRTLAPDMLYGDSGEFQALAYTLGMTHSTGYPIYLLIARLIGFLPLETFAWRVNLVSALGAAVTIGGVYLLIRYVTRSRIAAVLGSLALGMGYTFWSQAVIAEVYTPGLAFMTAALALLWRWRSEPARHTRSLFLAAMLSALGLGVHASVGLAAPAMVALVLATLIIHRARWSEWKRSLLAGFLGALAGLCFLAAAWLAIELHHPPSSFNNVMTSPSRSFWNLSPQDLDSPFERMYYTATALQWRDAMFPKDLDAWVEFQNYMERMLDLDFSALILWACGLGVVIMFWRAPDLASFLVIAFSTMMYYVLHYRTGDKYVFYLSSYVLVTIGLGSALGILLEGLSRLMRVDRNRWRLPFYAAIAMLLVSPVLSPHWPQRADALEKGLATFMREDYVFPLHSLKEPRGMAKLTLMQVPDNAVLIMEWRDLYATYYLAEAEKQSPGLIIYEGTPYGNDGGVALSMIQEIQKHLAEGRPVFTAQRFGRLEQYFKLDQLVASRWYRVLPR